jgi:ABC-2 type transport system ATP-binding protein
MSILISTQHIEEAEKICHKIIILKNGAIKIFDTPQNIKKQTGQVYKVLLNNSQKKPALEKSFLVKEIINCDESSFESNTSMKHNIVKEYQEIDDKVNEIVVPFDLENLPDFL